MRNGGGGRNDLIGQEERETRHKMTGPLVLASSQDAHRDRETNRRYESRACRIPLKQLQTTPAE